MPSFKKRSDKKELLDREGIPFDDIKRNMQELNIINRKLGGHGITLDGIVALIKDKVHFNQPLLITEIGCGGGDNLKAILDWSVKTNLPVRLTGVDKNSDCISYAIASQPAQINFIQSDYRDAVMDPKPDIIFSSLFCHHFQDSELVTMIQWMKQNTSFGFFINDLHRHPFAYYAIKIITSLFSKSYLVKNDAPLSVERGFTKKEWTKIFNGAGISNFNCRWKWAFRWLITCPNE